MINEGDLILLWKDDRHNYLMKAVKGRFHCDKGYIDTHEFIGKEFGDGVKTSLGSGFYLLRPNLSDLIMNLKRQTQIMYPKDIGYLLMKANLFPGAICIESGIGSGALTTAMANFVRPTGKVISYERNEAFIKNALKNLEKHSLAQFVEIKHREINPGDSYDETEVDFVMIDVGNQYDLVPAAYKALKGGAYMATICPTYDQLTQTVFTMEEVGFTNIETVEIQVRRILVRRGKTRPEQHMPCHTGFMVFGAKVKLLPPEQKPQIESAVTQEDNEPAESPQQLVE
jgi:tRNA (adenine57-N1/adenine58-N1)-methyltransferase